MRHTFKNLSSLATAASLSLVLHPKVAAAADKIQPQTGLNSLQDLPQAILTILFGFLPGVATFYLILTGYRYIVAQGNQELTEKAKKSLTYAVYGVIIAYASAAIILLFSDALGFNARFG